MKNCQNEAMKQQKLKKAYKSKLANPLKSAKYFFNSRARLQQIGFSKFMAK